MSFRLRYNKKLSKGNNVFMFRIILVILNWSNEVAKNIKICHYFLLMLGMKTMRDIFPLFPLFQNIPQLQDEKKILGNKKHHMVLAQYCEIFPIENQTQNHLGTTNIIQTNRKCDHKVQMLTNYTGKFQISTCQFIRSTRHERIRCRILNNSKTSTIFEKTCKKG